MAAERIGARGALGSTLAQVGLSVKGFRGPARAYGAVDNVAATTCECTGRSAERTAADTSRVMRSPDGHTLPVRGIGHADAVRFQAPPVPRAQLMYWRCVWITGVMRARATRSRTTARGTAATAQTAGWPRPNAGSSLEGPSPTNSASGMGGSTEQRPRGRRLDGLTLFRRRVEDQRVEDSLAVYAPAARRATEPPRRVSMTFHGVVEFGGVWNSATRMSTNAAANRPTATMRQMFAVLRSCLRTSRTPWRCPRRR